MVRGRPVDDVVDALDVRHEIDVDAVQGYRGSEPDLDDPGDVAVFNVLVALADLELVYQGSRLVPQVDVAVQ